jgi:uncharacterized membrane protein
MLIIALAISLECLVVAFAGKQVRHYAHKLELSERPGYIGRATDDLLTYYMMYFFMWLLSQGLATFIGVTLSYEKLSFQNRAWNRGFLSLTVMAILIIKWILQPWFISFTDLTGSSSQMQTDHFRSIIIPSNILIATICISVIHLKNMKSIREQSISAK